jgi:hypothetical protein
VLANDFQEHVALLFPFRRGTPILPGDEAVTVGQRLPVKEQRVSSRQVFFDHSDGLAAELRVGSEQVIDPPQNAPAELGLSRMDEPKPAPAPAEAFMRHGPHYGPR